MRNCRRVIKSPKNRPGNILDLTPSTKTMGVFCWYPPPLAAEGTPQTEDVNGSFQATGIGTQASHLAEIREVHF